MPAPIAAVPSKIVRAEAYRDTLKATATKGRAAGDDQGVVGLAALGVQGDAAQVEHGQDVGVADLVLEREPDHVEPIQRGEGLQAVQRQLVPAEGGLEVGQGGEDPLAGPVGGVHQAVEHLEAVVAHAQGVGVGEGQAERPPGRPVVLADAVHLAPQVLRGGLDIRQDPRGHLRA